MSNAADLNIVEDYLSLFNATRNDDAKVDLRKILSTPLTSKVEIYNRQSILKQIINSELYVGYTYHKIDYAEVFYFLNILDSKKFKYVDYLTYLFQKGVNNQLVGCYVQLSYFFQELDKILIAHLDVKKFPESYREDLRFIINYINSFELKKFKNQTAKGKLKYSTVQYLNKAVLQKRKNGDTAKFYTLFNRLEAYISIATVTEKLGFTFPQFVDQQFEIKQMYHPLLKSPVKNNFKTESNVILLTGANMSGKSTLLKTISLIVYFAHLGLAVPAEKAVLSFYEFISIHINHSDDIKNGLSHFMQEIVNMKRVLGNLQTGKRCFAVFDELYKGTNYEDALKISALTIDGLREYSHSKFLISTHIYELKNEVRNSESLSAYHLDCKVADNLPQFTYQLKEGWTNLKIGELLFEREGLKELLKR
jgi:DNA mismatch repair protein MutS